MIFVGQINMSIFNIVYANSIFKLLDKEGAVWFFFFKSNLI